MQRPCGTNQIYGGWIMLAVAAAAMIYGFNVDVSSYDPGSGTMRAIAIATGALLAGVAFTLLIAGWIIQAIYFLPGKEDAVRVTDQPVLYLDEQSGVRRAH